MIYGLDSGSRFSCQKKKRGGGIEREKETTSLGISSIATLQPSWLTFIRSYFVCTEMGIRVKR